MQPVVYLGYLRASVVLGLVITVKRLSLNSYPEVCLIVTSLLEFMVAFAFAKSIWRSPACCWLSASFILVRLRLDIVRINHMWIQHVGKRAEIEEGALGGLVRELACCNGLMQ